MIILGIDSSDEFVAAGISDNDRVLASSASTPEQRNKNYLHRLMEATLETINMKISDVEAVSVSVGPGSFTGLRVGLAAAKGICWSRKIPLLGISSLEAIAGSIDNKTGKILTFKDARRDEYYYATFEKIENEWVRLTPDQAGGIEEIKALINKGFKAAGRIECLQDRIPENNLSGMIDIDPNRIGGAIAVMGHKQLVDGNKLDVSSASPQYIRNPGIGKVRA